MCTAFSLTASLVSGKSRLVTSAKRELPIYAGNDSGRMSRSYQKKQIFLLLFFGIYFRHTVEKQKRKKEKKKMLKNNSSTGYDKVEFYIDFVQVLLSAFMLGYLIGKKKKEKDA